jgi:hypothetical protein
MSSCPTQASGGLELRSSGAGYSRQSYSSYPTDPRRKLCGSWVVGPDEDKRENAPRGRIFFGHSNPASRCQPPLPVRAVWPEHPDMTPLRSLTAYSVRKPSASTVRPSDPASLVDPSDRRTRPPKQPERHGLALKTAANHFVLFWPSFRSVSVRSTCLGTIPLTGWNGRLVGARRRFRIRLRQGRDCAGS